jgi:hypothetical protein
MKLTFANSGMQHRHVQRHSTVSTPHLRTDTVWECPAITTRVANLHDLARSQTC